MKIERMNKGEWGKIKAFFDIEVDATNSGDTVALGFVIKGFKLVEGVNGLFVGFPSQKGSDGEYHDTVYADKETKDKLQETAINHYNSEE